MTEPASLLIELGTEELPPKALDALAAAFAQGICAGLAQRGITADTANAHPFCTPRRLAVHVPAVAPTQPDQTIERRGPAVKAGRDAEGKPTRALAGFAGSCGVDPEQLQTHETDKGAWYVYRATKPGRATAELIPEILAETLKNLPIPRPMRWGDHDYNFVRPVHWLVIVHGDQVIETRLMGLVSTRASRGHRFHHPGEAIIGHADEWEQALQAAYVITDPEVRRRAIREQVGTALEALAASGFSGTAQLSEALLDELANLTEWPRAIACTFERAFLDVPAEALITTMEANQKFVPVLTVDGALSEHFIGIANIDSKQPEAIRKGYERVIRPRFADAQFFYTEDLKTPLADLQKDLAAVTYQQALGSLWDKSCRVAELARVIANRVGVDAGLATRAASLSKCDLTTRMVGEFPELQGVMGRYYARAQGEDEAVAQALDEYYMPRHAADHIATGGVARVLAVADRLDTLAGIFAVGMKPSGNKDPFALRRAALGLARTFIEGGMDIDLNAALREALDLIPDAALLPSPGKRGAGADVPPSPTKQGAGADVLPSPAKRGAGEDVRTSPAERGAGEDVRTSPAKRGAGEDVLPSPSGRGAGGEGPPPAKSQHSSPSAATPADPAALSHRRRDLAAELTTFIVERLRGYYADQGFSHGPFEAVLAIAPRTLTDFDRRLRAVADFSARPEAASLAAANKRVGNILRKQAAADGAIASHVDFDLFADAAERDLAAALTRASAASREAVKAGDYAGALAHLSALQTPVDRFFDEVLVMADDPAVRANRLALLAQLQAQFLAIADVACLPAAS